MKRPISQDGHPAVRNGHGPSLDGDDTAPRPFIVSAPGKVIVFGEHSVVHGKTAMAASISLRSYLLVSPSDAERKHVTLALPDIKLKHTWHLDELPFKVFSQESKAKRFDDRVTTLDDDLLAAIQPHIEAMSPNMPEKARKTHHAAASAFLYVLLSLGVPSMPSYDYIMRSNIPIGAGLGSSASISVCLATAILLQNQHIQTPSTITDSKYAEQVLDIINHWAFVGELCIHGNPSGVDNTVATKGKAVLFRRTQPGHPPDVKALHNFPSLPLLLVDTKQSRSTATEVAKVGALKTAHPVVADLILDAMDKITESAHNLISSPDFKTQDPASLQHLGELFRVNHGLLVSLGVSHPKLERVRELVDEADIGYTKLTGAGGGGCAITLIKPTTTEDMLELLEQQLVSEGFAKYETVLGGGGVAVIDNMTPTSGEEFARKMMSKPLNKEDVESLSRLTQEGWQCLSTKAAVAGSL